MKKKKARFITRLCLCLTITILFGLCPTGIVADFDGGDPVHDVNQAEAFNGEMVATAATDGNGSDVVDGAVYALKNHGSGLWASVHASVSASDGMNLFQRNSWTNAAQTFRFVQTDVDTYVIYPL